LAIVSNFYILNPRNLEIARGLKQRKVLGVKLMPSDGGGIIIRINDLIGDENSFPMKHRILNIILLLGSSTAFGSSLISFWLQPDKTPAWASLVFIGVIIAGIYYYSYRKKMYNSVIMIALLAAIVIIPVVWVETGGMHGRVPIYLTLFTPMVVILLDKRQRILVTAILIIITNSLIFIEHKYPAVVGNYTMSPTHDLDFAIAFTLAIIIGTVVFITILRYYEKEAWRAAAYLEQRQRAQESLYFLSYNDVLTGLNNRARFENVIVRVSTEPEYEIGVFFVDVDGLKFINDTLGHKCGDALLKRVAWILRRSFPESTSMFRIGGDEFVILMPSGNPTQMEECYKSIRDNIQKENDKQQDPLLLVNLSCGYALGVNQDVHNVLHEAESKMYREKLLHHTSENRTIIHTVKQMLAARDFDTGVHSERLEKLIVDLAGLAGMAPSSTADLVLFARFHDIGKVGLADHILLKPGPLTKKERREMQQHCEIGWRIANASTDLLPIADWILKHHEWWDGNGYPLGLKAEEIPFECRLLAIVDSYDAMVSDRPYRKALSRQNARDELIRCSGSQFDPDLVNIFLVMVGDQQHSDNPEAPANMAASAQ
jgi:diguanylate cyclase (GGDEF)-like protein